MVMSDSDLWAILAGKPLRPTEVRADSEENLDCIVEERTGSPRWGLKTRCWSSFQSSSSAFPMGREELTGFLVNMLKNIYEEVALSGASSGLWTQSCPPRSL